MTASLAALQARFIAAVLDEAPLEGVAPADALALYRRNAASNFRAALAATFPVVRRLVGEAFFAEAARRYARAHGSASGDLHGYGDRLPVFLESYAPAASLPYLPDVARLEWAFHESRHAADAQAFDFAALLAVPPEAHPFLRLKLAPSVRLLASRHAVLAIWEANQPERDGTPDRTEGPDHVVVWRAALEPAMQRVDGAAWRFLLALRDGETLEGAGGALGADEGRLPELLAHWVRAGAIAGFESNGACA